MSQRSSHLQYYKQNNISKVVIPIPMTWDLKLFSPRKNTKKKN